MARRFASNPAQFVRRLKRAWRTRRGRIIVTYAVAGTGVVVMMFAGIAFEAWGQRRAAVAACVLGTLALAAHIVGAYLPAKRYRFRFDRGLCIQCGYDLRGSVGRVCPECGVRNQSVKR
jgi:hypothetical protein